MKIIIVLLALIILTVADLRECIQERCPDQFQKCEDKSGCEDSLWKCEAKCGAAFNPICWTFCLGGPGVAADVAICANNQGCL